MFYIFLNRQRRPVLGDSGCTFTCMDLDFYQNNPYLKRFFVPRKSSGKSINGEPVYSEGEVVLKFRLADVPMSMNCKIIRNLMDPVILGWDWMTKYGVVLDAKNGKVRFGEGKVVDLIANHFPLRGCYYRAFEDLILPPFSKVHTNVEMVLSGDAVDKVTSTVVTEPFSNNGVNFWAA